MLKVFPIPTKEEQERICSLCRIPFDADLLAYEATVDDVLVGICQFTMKPEGGVIHRIAHAEGTHDTEALFVLGRAALNFIDLCGVHTAVCLDTELDPALVHAIGFRLDENGKQTVDLKDFFDHPCQRHKE